MFSFPLGTSPLHVLFRISFDIASLAHGSFRSMLSDFPVFGDFPVVTLWVVSNAFSVISDHCRISALSDTWRFLFWPAGGYLGKCSVSVGDVLLVGRGGHFCILGGDFLSLFLELLRVAGWSASHKNRFVLSAVSLSNSVFASCFSRLLIGACAFRIVMPAYWICPPTIRLSLK